MDLGLAGKKAFFTGSTKGLGRGFAEALLAEGASVAICARNADEVAAAVAELSTKGTVVGASVDAGDPEALRAWVRSAAEQLGGLDIYVHNTSGKPAKALADWEKNFHIDLMALIHGVEEATPFLAAGGGALVTIGTTATAEHFASGSNSYSAFKAAATNWTLGQAQPLGAKAIRCNFVPPAPIMVPGGDWDRIKGAKPEFFEATAKVHPGGNIGEVADVADLVTFLVSPRAKHVNGANVTVDGGFLKRVNY